MNVSKEPVTFTFTLKMGANSSSDTLIIIYHFAQCLIAKEYNIIPIIVNNLKLHITFIMFVVTVCNSEYTDVHRLTELQTRNIPVHGVMRNTYM